MKTSKLLLGIVWLHMALAAQAAAAGVGVNNAAAPMANADVMLEKNVLTLKGIVDPRLYVWVKSVYRPMDYSNQEECTRYNLITGGRKGLLDYEGFKHGHTLGSKWRPLPDKTLKKHYCLASGSQIACFTTYFQGVDRSHFTCLPQSTDTVNGADALTSQTLSFSRLPATADDNRTIKRSA